MAIVGGAYRMSVEMSLYVNSCRKSVRLCIVLLNDFVRDSLPAVYNCHDWQFYLMSAYAVVVYTIRRVQRRHWSDR